MDYRNPAVCLDALKRLNPVNLDESQATLGRMLDDLLAARPAANQHLEVLEAIRAPLALVQAEISRPYAAHPLPPGSREDGTLRRVVSLWRLMARSYAEVMREDAPFGTIEDQRALLAQRRVFYTGQSLLEHFRAHRALPAGIWQELHDSFSLAETQGVGQIRVADDLNEVWHAQSPAEAYIAVLLVDLSNPYGRSEREFEWVCRWAQRFAPYCSLLPGEKAEGEVKATAYGLDLDLDHGLRPIGTMGDLRPTQRRFDGSRLAGQIQAVMAQFKQGVQPSSLGLGEDCSIEASAKLLVSLYRPWGLGSAGRRFPRRGAAGIAELTGDWLAVGFQVGGKLFKQPTLTEVYRSFRSDISLLTFGERAEEAPLEDPEQVRRREEATLGFTCERWEMLDHSLGGFRLRHPPPAERLDHHQLVAVRPADGEAFLLGQVSWLMYREDGVLEAGIHVLTGLPKVVAVRLAGAGSMNRGAYQQAFWLPATPALKKPASLVLPGGWFQPHRMIEIHDGKSRQVRLDQLVLRGANFDQVTYEAEPSGV